MGDKLVPESAANYNKHNPLRHNRATVKVTETTQNIKDADLRRNVRTNVRKNEAPANE